VLFIIAPIISIFVSTLCYRIHMGTKERIVASLYLVENCCPNLFWKQCANLLLHGNSVQPFNESVLES